MNKVFDALADPSRRTILELLNDKDMCVSEMLKHFEFRQASLSHHLKVLKEAKLVTSQRRWQFVYYSLHKTTLQQVVLFFQQFFQNDQ